MITHYFYFLNGIVDATWELELPFRVVAGDYIEAKKLYSGNIRNDFSNPELDYILSFLDDERFIVHSIEIIGVKKETQLHVSLKATKC